MSLYTLETVHQRLLIAQKKIRLLSDAAYADHRLIEKLNNQLKINTTNIEKLIIVVRAMSEDDNK